MSDALTQKDSMSRLMVEPVQAVRLWDSEVRSTQSGAVMRTETISREACESTLARKGAGLIVRVPVPQTDAGGRGENPKTNERTIVKELGKMTP